MSFIEGGSIMNDKESKIFYEVLDVLNKKKIEHPKLFNNTKIKFLLKDERFISNNVVKGIIMFELDNQYIVDIYIDNGVDNIVNGLLNLRFDDFELAKKQYNESLEYLDYTDITTILVNGKQQLLSFN